MNIPADLPVPAPLQSALLLTQREEVERDTYGYW